MVLSKSLSLGQKLRLIREAKNLTLQELSDATAVDIGTISKIERGLTKNPGIQSASKLANALEISPAFLTTSTEDGDEDLQVALSLQSLRIFFAIHRFSENQQLGLRQLCYSDAAPNSVRSWQALIKHANYLVERGIVP